jgi:hypothetical protein
MTSSNFVADIFIDTSVEFACRIPNVNHAVDNGEDLFTIFMPFWADDISGVRLKQYQKHMNIYAMNANIPSSLQSQEYHVKFVSTSPFAGALEMFKPIVQAVIQSHQKPIQTWDVSTNHPCGVRSMTPDLPADNPQQSDESSHIGHQGKCKCRECHVGGETGFDATENTYPCFYAPGRPRNVQEIKENVLKQIQLASLGRKTEVANEQTRTGTKDKIAQYWIEILIKMAKEDQAKGEDEETVSEKLLVWLKTQTPHPYNALLDMPCEYFYTII